jgi:superfamily II DNA/RNA helicase
MKASQIAKQLRLDVHEVYVIVANMKRSAKRIMKGVDLTQVQACGLTSEDQIGNAVSQIEGQLQQRVRKRSFNRMRKDNKKDNPLLLQEMEHFFEVNGIYSHTSQEVRNYLLEKL